MTPIAAGRLGIGSFVVMGTLGRTFIPPGGPLGLVPMEAIRIGSDIEAMPMIEVVNVWKSYRSGTRWVEALRGINCRIDRGRFAFIVGPERFGQKHAAVPAGCDRPADSGPIIVDGQNWSPCPRDAESLSTRAGRLHLPVVQPDQQPLGAGERACARSCPGE